jgi:hypothetical protein
MPPKWTRMPASDERRPGARVELDLAVIDERQPPIDRHDGTESS